MFTKEELNNLLVFLNRVNLTGQEALVMAQLQLKIQQDVAKLKTNEPKKDEETTKK